jgi:pyrimidine operon attenuation protein / uracil phosphoribosyltransferase
MASQLEDKKILLDAKQLAFILHRLSHQLIETHTDFSNTILLGVQPRGIVLCDIIHSLIEEKLGKKIYKGTLDISMHRDDIHLHGTHLSPQVTQIPISLENKNVVLIDDVLYTGRTIRSALDTLMDFGRPRDIELLVLIDRRLLRHVPIEAKYIGKSIDSIQHEKVMVSLSKTIEHSKIEITTLPRP